MPELEGAELELDFDSVSGAALDEVDEVAGAAELVAGEAPDELELPHPATASAASTATSVASPRVLLARAISCILVLLVRFLLARGQVQARRMLTVSSSKDAVAGKCFRRRAAVR
jgi:hypothetical protein